MKETFYHLDEGKRRRIEEAALEEFGTYGYERGSTDRIIRKSGISKGGLYEYIESKEALFLHIVERAYGALYDWIFSSLRAAGGPPSDLAERVMAASTAALHFYIGHPMVVRLIASLASTSDPDAKAKTDTIFDDRFLALFGDCDFSVVRFPREKVLDLVRWLLVKTRNDFVAQIEGCGDSEQVSTAYLAEWEFIVAVLSGGVFDSRRN